MEEKDNEENIIMSSQIESSECLICKHLVEDDNLSCAAYPEGIPIEVYRKPHHKKHPLQQGEITFEIDNQLTEVYEMVYDKDGNRIPKLKPYDPEEEGET